MKISILRFVLLYFAFSFNLFSQKPLSPDSKNTWQLLTYDVGTIFKGIGYSYTRPLFWNGDQWSTFGSVLAGTGLLYLVDEETTHFFEDHGSDVPIAIRDYGRNVGSPNINYTLTSAVYLTGLFAKDEKLRRTGVLLVASATSAGLLQQVLKTVVGRARPLSGQSKDTFDPFNPDRNYHSFPSGHTMVAFTNGYALGKQFKNPWIKGGIYTIALIPGLSRLWENEHWFSDVALGVAISIFTVESIDRYLDRKYQQKYLQKDKKISWNVQFGIGRIGLIGSF